MTTPDTWEVEFARRVAALRTEAAELGADRALAELDRLTLEHQRVRATLALVRAELDRDRAARGG